MFDKTTLIRNNWEKGCTKSVRVIYVYIYNIYSSTRSDRLCAPSFLNYFESEWFYRDGPFTKNVSFGGARKNVIYSKLVNNPFKCKLTSWNVLYLQNNSNFSTTQTISICRCKPLQSWIVLYILECISLLCKINGISQWNDNQIR